MSLYDKRPLIPRNSRIHLSIAFALHIVATIFFCAHSHLKFFFYPTSPLELRIIYYGSVHEMRKTLLFRQNTFLDSKLMLMSIINKLYKALYFEEFKQFEKFEQFEIKIV